MSLWILLGDTLTGKEEKEDPSWNGNSKKIHEQEHTLNCCKIHQILHMQKFNK